MIDTFSIVLSHGLLAVMLWRLLHRADLDHEDTVLGDTETAPKSNDSWHKNKDSVTQKGFRNRA